MNQRIELLAKAGATMRSLEESVDFIAVLIAEVQKQTKAKDALIRLWNDSGNAESNTKEHLRNLVNALDNAYISSWQSTHAWRNELNLAREHLKGTEND